jgi:hypothetical protein
MPDNQKDLKTKIEELSQEVASLSRRVGHLEEKLTSVHEPVKTTTSDIPESAQSKTQTRTASLTTGGVAALFSRFTAISIILLFALVLRTVTDSGMIDVTIGSLLGIVYASLLEGTGWVMYRRSYSLAPIFSISGGLLLFAVVLETQSSFGSISSVTAYTMLIVGAGGMAVMSHMQRVAIPVIAGTIGIIVAGLPIDFPDPNFLYLAIFLFAVNVMAFSVVNLPKCWWLRIVTFAVTAMTYMAWSYKIYSIRMIGGPVEDIYFGGWLIPALTVMSAFYVGYVFFRIPRRRDIKVGRFDSLLPTLTSAWGYMLARLYLPSDMKVMMAVGAFGTFIALVFLLMAFVIVRRREEGASGINTLVFPAAFLLAISFRDLSGESVIALAVLSLVAHGLTYLSAAWRSAGVRVTSYFLQATVMVASFLLLFGQPSGVSPIVTITAMAVISVVAFFHYRRMRVIEPPQPSEFFTRVDRGDKSAVILLLASLTAAFLGVRAGAYELLGGETDAFKCAQSIIINVGAALLFLKAYHLRRTEIRNVAVLVTVIGALKVFVIDLFGARGIPLVMSVLSLGVAAALGSVILGKWHRLEPEDSDL